MAKYSLVMTPTPCNVAGWISLRIRALVHLLTYLLTYLRSWIGAYKTETVEDRAKVTINGQYKVIHGLSITAKMFDLE